MLAAPVSDPALLPGWAGEPKWDGYRVQLAVYTGGRVLLRSRRGTDMTAAFPEIRAAALAQLPADTGIDGELVVWARDRLAFERLQQRLARRGAAAAQATREWPAHFVAFDLVQRGGDLTVWPYARRRRRPARPWHRSGLRGRRPGWRDCASSGWRSPIAGACGRGGSTRCGSPRRP
ncbi:hypothetical protein ACIP4U_24240 [Streptomyces caelestis]|uniref:ATP-dependent DNA ligase n=1 Tax=Streptomyces caelestis TaxID=36816 RepID=UPI00380B1631